MRILYTNIAQYKAVLMVISCTQVNAYPATKHAKLATKDRIKAVLLVKMN
jgi:hypothetical protein